MAQKPIIMERMFNPVDPKHIEEVQKRLGVKFPSLLIECIENNNEGRPQRSDFDLTFPDGKREPCGLAAFLSFNLNDKHNIVSDHEDPPEYFAQGLIAFATTGGAAQICFDYRKGKNNENPPVVYWSYEYEQNEGIAYIAENFDDFMDMMYEPEDKYW